MLLQHLIKNKFNVYVYFIFLTFLLQSNKIDRLVKPAVLSCFGDVALAIGPNFTRYYEYVMAMLVMALSTAKVEDPVSANMN